MEYRKMEKINANTSLLGFGCMRFPTLVNGEIDEKEADLCRGSAGGHGLCLGRHGKRHKRHG